MIKVADSMGHKHKIPKIYINTMLIHNVIESNALLQLSVRYTLRYFRFKLISVVFFLFILFRVNNIELLFLAGKFI